jgi:hypothetical protein
VLLWSPADFWAANVWDVTDAYDGWAQANGVAKDTQSKLSEDDVQELRTLIEEEQRKDRLKHGNA